MSALAGTLVGAARPLDHLSGTPRARALDRWIYVFTAALFVLIVLVGFIPDSIGKIAEVRAGRQPPFPLVLHVHAVLMASFLILLLAQTTLVALGRTALHAWLGRAAFVIVPALVVVGFLLVPTMYHQTSAAMTGAPPAVRAELQQVLLFKQDIMLLQLRVGLLFPLLLALGLRARTVDAGFHKRMMILASATPLDAAIDRMQWLPSLFPASPAAADLYLLAALAPMVLWDVLRNRRLHRAYLLGLAINIPAALAVYGLWGTPLWHATARAWMGV